MLYEVITVWLVHHALVALACGSRLVCVYARYNQNAVFYLFLRFCKAADIFQHCFFIVCRAWADQQKEFAAFAGEYLLNLIKLLVITSYSIHYTKLYDINSEPADAAQYAFISLYNSPAILFHFFFSLIIIYN